MILLLSLLDNGEGCISNIWKLDSFRLIDKTYKSLCQHRIICIIYKENSKCNMHVKRANATERLKRILKFISKLILVIFWLTKLLYDNLIWKSCFSVFCIYKNHTLNYVQLKLWLKKSNINSARTEIIFEHPYLKNWKKGKSKFSKT